MNEWLIVAAAIAFAALIVISQTYCKKADKLITPQATRKPRKVRAFM